MEKEKIKAFLFHIIGTALLAQGLAVFTVPALSKGTNSVIAEKLSPLENHSELCIKHFTEGTVVPQEQDVSERFYQQPEFCYSSELKSTQEMAGFGTELIHQDPKQISNN